MPRGPEQGVDLLRLLVGDGGGDGLGIAGRDGDLGAAALLAFADPFGDVGGKCLGVEGGLAEDDLVDRLSDDLLEAGHVDPCLLGVEVDEALHLGEVEMLGAVDLDPDHLLDPGYSNPREADLRRGGGGLHVGGADREGGRLRRHCS